MVIQSNDLNETETILVVDDDQSIRDIVRQIMERAGYNILTAENGAEALKLLNQNSIGLVITDVRMPEISGVELMEIIKEKFDTDVIVMTGFAEDFTYEKIMKRGASDFLKKPMNPNELLVRVQHVLTDRSHKKERNQVRKELVSSLDKLNRVLGQTVSALTLTVEMRDPYTAGHQERVSRLAAAVAHEMGFSEDHTESIRTAGLVHDIGKICVPSEILSKPGRLLAAEFDLIKNHSQIGYEILNGVEFTLPIAEITLQHHERMNGKGYPGGIAGQDIPIESRILAVSDVVEAMSSHRPYRAALGMAPALEEIKKNRKKLYDSEVVDACLTLFEDKNFQI